MKTQLRKLVVSLAPVIGVALGASAFEASAQVNPSAPPTTTNAPATPATPAMANQPSTTNQPGMTARPSTPASPNAATAPFTPGATLPSTASSQAQAKSLQGLSLVDTSGKSWGTISNVAVEGDQATLTLEGASGSKIVVVPLATVLAGQSASGVTLSTSDLAASSTNGMNVK